MERNLFTALLGFLVIVAVTILQITEAIPFNFGLLVKDESDFYASCKIYKQKFRSYIPLDSKKLEYLRNIKYEQCRTKKTVEVAIKVNDQEILAELFERYVNLLLEEGIFWAKVEVEKKNKKIFSFLELNGKQCELKQTLFSGMYLECRDWYEKED